MRGMNHLIPFNDSYCIANIIENDRNQSKHRDKHVGKKREKEQDLINEKVKQKMLDEIDAS